MHAVTRCLDRGTVTCSDEIEWCDCLEHRREREGKGLQHEARTFFKNKKSIYQNHISKSSLRLLAVTVVAVGIATPKIGLLAAALWSVGFDSSDVRDPLDKITTMQVHYII